MAVASLVPPAELGVPSLFSPWAYTENVQVKFQVGSVTQTWLRTCYLTPV